MPPFDRAKSSSPRPSDPKGLVAWRDRQPAWAFRPFSRGAGTPYSESTDTSRARLSFVLLVYLVAFVAVLQLAPFGFLLPTDLQLVAISDWRDALSSLLLFVPLGFLYPLTRAHGHASTLQVAAWGLLIATLIASAQLFEADRDIALADIVLSAIGAGLGGSLLERVNRRTRASARLAKRLSLEIPLAGLVYLLLPLAIATSVSAVDDIRRLLILLPLGLLAARLLSGLQQHHFGPAHVFSVRSMSVIAVGWMMLGAFPALLRYPLLSLGIALLAGVVTLYSASRPSIHGKERRFEADILKSSMPYVVVYFLDVVLLPLAAGIDRWHFGLGLTGAHDDLARQIVHLMEPVASLVMLGYLLAETRGRRELPFARVALRVTMECAAVAAVIEASRGFQLQVGASALEFIVLVVAAILGAGMYHHQRERVRWMLIHRVGANGVTRR